MKITTLKNGLRVGNFSSPHDFKFDDGTILEAVSDTESQRLKVTFNETELNKSIVNGNTTLILKDIKLDFGLSDVVRDEMADWLIVQDRGDVDVVLIPLPMLTATESEYSINEIITMPFRCIRIEDRTNKIISSRKFCI